MKKGDKQTTKETEDCATQVVRVEGGGDEATEETEQATMTAHLRNLPLADPIRANVVVELLGYFYFFLRSFQA